MRQKLQHNKIRSSHTGREGPIAASLQQGALDFLMEQEYYIPHVIGVSAGACNALDYVSRQIGRNEGTV